MNAETNLAVARAALFGVAAVLLAIAPAGAEAQQFLPQKVVSSTIPANGDVNPYGVAVVPANFPMSGPLNAGDVLVSNFNNQQNLQGTGTTIIQLTPNGEVAPSGSASVFFQGSNLGLTTALGVLQRGFVLVGNVPTTDGTFATLQPGSLLVLDQNGNVISSLTKMLDGPWDLTIVDGFDHARVFVSNVLNGTVTRLDLAVGASNVTVTAAHVIASGYGVAPNDAALILGPTGLAYDPASDILYVASTDDNKVFGVARAGSRNKSEGRGAVVFKNKHLRGPLALTFAPNGHLLAANGDAVNADPNEPSEIVEFTIGGQFIGQMNVDAAEGGAFGLAVANIGNGVTRFAFVDDNAANITVSDTQQ